MQSNTLHANGISPTTNRLTKESYAGDVYEYYPLGTHVVAAPAVCGGRPTFKYTRIEVRMILAYLAEGKTIPEIVKDYGRKELTTEAIREALLLASSAFDQSIYSPQLIAA